MHKDNMPNSSGEQPGHAPGFSPDTHSSGAQMRALLEDARARGLCLHAPYQDLWFFPDELEREQSMGLFLWGPENWQLRDPFERIDQLAHEAARTGEALRLFQKRRDQASFAAERRRGR